MPYIAALNQLEEISIAQHYIVEVLKRLKTYSFLSLPYYSLDCLGFHVPVFRPLAKFKPTYYRLYDGTQFIFRFFTNDRCIIGEIFINKAYTPNRPSRLEVEMLSLTWGSYRCVSWYLQLDTQRA